MGLSLGSGLPRLAPRVLGDERALPRHPFRPAHGRGRPHRRAPHQRDRAERVRLRRAPLGGVLAPQRVPRLCRREDGEVDRQRAAPRRSRRARDPAARVPLLLPPGALPAAAELQRRGDRRRRDGLRPAAGARGRRPRRGGPGRRRAHGGPARALPRRAARRSERTARARGRLGGRAQPRARRGGAGRPAARLRRGARPRPRARAPPRGAARERPPDRRARRRARGRAPAARLRGGGPDPRRARRRGHRARGHPLRPALAPRGLVSSFRLVSAFEPRGDQPRAIEELVAGIERGDAHQTLLGVTGSGKSFTVACVVEKIDRPTLVMAPNKTLAAQLYAEFRGLFPENAVEYFVSYYDYYQPEAYIPSSDTYIEKDSSINDEIDKLRHSTTHSLLTRRDVLVVASVSAIYGLGTPATYGSMHAFVEPGMRLDRDEFLRRLVDMLYERNDVDFHRGTFRVRGDVVEVFPQYEAERAVRIEFFGDEVEAVAEIDPLRGKVVARPRRAMIYPASHYVATEEVLERAIAGIREELRERVGWFQKQGKLLEAQRLEQRTRFDVEMLQEMGFCHGVENYSRWLDGREAGQTPYTLYDYFPEDLLVVLDESHVSVPQIGGMFRGDRARKETLVEFGFRLPSALDNRPLRFEEWETRAPQRLYASATPAGYELERSRGVVVEQIIRPTGLMDPKVEVRRAGGQVDDLLGEIRKRVEAGERVLVTTLTKRMAEELTEYYAELGIDRKSVV